MSGLSESPKPGRSMAITRLRSASALSVGRNEALVPPSPCRQSRGGPSPASIVEIRPARVSIERNRSRPGSSDPLTAARKPVPRCRLRRTASRPRLKAPMPPRRSRAMAAQVAASAEIDASGLPWAGSRVARSPSSTASHASRDRISRRIRARPRSRSMISGS